LRICDGAVDSAPTHSSTSLMVHLSITCEQSV
jgi:hypothetical protein